MDDLSCRYTQWNQDQKGILYEKSSQLAPLVPFHHRRPPAERQTVHKSIPVNSIPQMDYTHRYTY